MDAKERKAAEDVSSVPGIEEVDYGEDAADERPDIEEDREATAAPRKRRKVEETNVGKTKANDKKGKEAAAHAFVGSLSQRPSADTAAAAAGPQKRSAVAGRKAAAVAEKTAGEPVEEEAVDDRIVTIRGKKYRRHRRTINGFVRGFKVPVELGDNWEPMEDGMGWRATIPFPVAAGSSGSKDMP